MRCRHIDGILMCYEKIYKSINVDQPKADVFSQGELSFVYCILSDLNDRSRQICAHPPLNSIFTNILLV